MSDKKVSIHESYTLPSSGSDIYDFEVPEVVTLRAMSTLDEKLRLSSSNGILIIPQLIKQCMIEPKDLDVAELKMFDIQYLMYMLRIATYGPDYKVELRCPECGHVFTAEMLLSDIPVNSVPDDIHEQLTITLPVSGDVVECSLQSASDITAIQYESKRILSKFPEYVGDPEFIIRWKYIIKTVNGAEVPKKDIQSYIESMHAKDGAYLRSKYEKVVNSIGMDLSRIDICPECGEEVQYSLPVTTEFFRPSFD